MKICRFFLTVLAVALLFSATASAQEAIANPAAGGARGPLFHFSSVDDPRPMPGGDSMPMPIAPPNPSALGKASPSATGRVSGITMLTPRGGGAMMTAKQRADRDVSRVIKKLQ